MPKITRICQSECNSYLMMLQSLMEQPNKQLGQRTPRSQTHCKYIQIAWVALSSNCIASAAESEVDFDACGIWRVNKRAANADTATKEPEFKSQNPPNHPKTANRPPFPLCSSRPLKETNREPFHSSFFV
nr:uncharacterized protein LOC116650929 [Drosophila virilis]